MARFDIGNAMFGQVDMKSPPADYNRATCIDLQQTSIQLKYFDKYSYSNCFVECKYDYLIQKCGCTSFILPGIYIADVLYRVFRMWDFLVFNEFVYSCL